MWKSMLAVLMQNKGKTAGVALGLISGVLFLTLGFWRTLALLFCVLMGLAVGMHLDGDRRIAAFLQRLFQKNDDD